ncbi:MAG: LptF/LptG family permease [Prolixibacteraceae bacterium]|jgi:lipopolysaccharide export system permease protein|nr:LptF/LptG family permease [Bacteroidota bacterium]HOF55501.1 LptF/LptG family permease [Prolixibacteraceae bacterium]HOS00031.1 LptF/LptG family permease [Prolixibacteraceae bacterium]HOS91050.1 LptF/LptG family permease [Prolixibacteraceae bacterium]HPL45497.1 LptF/LptG family permease [Prolixibacteraceae bacterium]
MKRLHWYVFKTFVGPFFMTFFICVFILLMQFLWKYVDDLVGKGLDWGILAELLFYATFGLLPFAFPLAMLLASIMTFGELGENYELVAMKSSGISLFRIMKPLILVALLITGTAFFFANYILPHTNLRFTTLLWSVKEQRPEMVLQEGVFTSDIDGYSVRVGKIDNKTNTLHDILIYDHTNNKTNESVTVADSGFLNITEDKNYMVLTLYNGENFSEESMESGKTNYPFRRDRFYKQVLNVRVMNFDFQRRDENVFRNSYRMLNIKQLMYAKDSLETDYKLRVRNFVLNTRYMSHLNLRLYARMMKNDSLLASYAADSIKYIDPAILLPGNNMWNRPEVFHNALYTARNNFQEINNIENNLYGRKRRINAHSMEFHRKFTLSFAVLIFFFIGAPLGAIIRKGGLGMPVVVSILLFILYYIFSMTGEKSAREDVWNMTAGMWFSTFVFLPVGIFLTYKAVTDSAIMSAETYTNFLRKILPAGLIKRFLKHEDITTDQ